MCGIIGYLGKKALPVLIEGLERLEYRGYDSAGIAVYCRGKIVSIKSVGRVNLLKEKIAARRGVDGVIGIAHTRWATHGKPSEKNAHPHCDCKKDIWVCHNGIIENYKELKDWLIKRGHKFRSETDTEVLPHLMEEFYDGNLENALVEALKRVRGAYAVVAISKNEPEKIVAAKNSSPLIIGVGEKEYIIASDVSAILNHTKKVIYLNDGEAVVMGAGGIKFLDLLKKKVSTNLSERTQVLDWDLISAQKSGYPHFMLKEIFEQPESIANSLAGRLIVKGGLAKLGGLEGANPVRNPLRGRNGGRQRRLISNGVKNKVANIKRILISACGTAFYASLAGEYMIEEKAGIPVEVDLASEFRYRRPIIDKNTAFIVVSQSGETADSLAALREAKEKGALTLGIVNTVGSTIARETDAGVYNHAGPEIGVASTKAFTSQLSIFALIVLFLARPVRSRPPQGGRSHSLEARATSNGARQRQMSLAEGKNLALELEKIPEKIKQILKTAPQIKKIAAKYKNFKNFFFLGRKYNYPVALEGALKLKEISYVHAEGYGAGELKHGPIALIDKNFPSVFIATENSVYEKTISNIEEIKARGGPIIAITNIGNKKIARLVDDIIYVPKTIEMLEPILNVIPLQLLAYYIGTMKGHDVDKPRNLAKSVTVE